MQGEGPYIQSQRELPDFNGIELSGGMKLDVIVGGPTHVVIHADENLHEYIRTRVEDGVLEIDFTESVSSSNDFRAEISVPSLNSIEVAGSSQMNVTGIDAEDFELDVAGSAKGTMSGNVHKLEVDVAGSSKLQLFDLVAQSVKIDVAGSANIEVAAEQHLDVDIAGSGVVHYKGSPSVSIDQAGSAKVVAVDAL